MLYVLVKKRYWSLEVQNDYGLGKEYFLVHDNPKHHKEYRGVISEFYLRNQGLSDRKCGCGCYPPKNLYVMMKLLNMRNRDND